MADVSCLLTGHPLSMVRFNSCITLSPAVDCVICSNPSCYWKKFDSANTLELPLRVGATWKGARLRVSARYIWGPGLYVIVMFYLCSFSSIHCSLLGALLNDLTWERICWRSLFRMLLSWTPRSMRSLMKVSLRHTQNLHVSLVSPIANLSNS